MPHITFIHGILNKPPLDRLLVEWHRALAEGQPGLDLNAKGVTYSMVYWADVLYEAPLAPSAAPEALGDPVEREGTDISWRFELPPDERRWVDSMAAKMKVDAPIPDEETPTERPPEGIRVELERIPLPWWIKREAMKALLRDVHHYLFNETYSPRSGALYRVQTEIRRRTVAAIQDGAARPRPHVVVSHSMGTVIAYDCLERVADCPAVDELMTIGSPLGIDEVQDQLRSAAPGEDGWSRADGFPKRKVRGGWVNVYDPLDPVCGFDPVLVNDYLRGGLPAVDDVKESNYGAWRHDIVKYLAGEKLQGKLRTLLGLG